MIASSNLLVWSLQRKKLSEREREERKEEGRKEKKEKKRKERKEKKEKKRKKRKEKKRTERKEKSQYQLFFSPALLQQSAQPFPRHEDDGLDLVRCLLEPS